MTRARTKVVLLAEYISSGGTRKYVERLLRFYAARGARVTMVHTWASPDEAISALAEETGASLVPYSLVNPRPIATDHWGDKALAPVWSPMAMRKERRHFHDFFSREEPDYVVVSTGTPGMFLGAAGAVPAATYILHTYPHGRRTRYLGPWLLRSYIPRGLKVVAVSDFQARAIRTHWALGRAPDRVVVVPSTAGPIEGASDLVRDAEPVVLTAAGVVDYKQPFDWIRVAELVCESYRGSLPRFEWIGEGPLLDAAVARVAAGTASGSVTFEGMQNDVDAYYARCAVYLQLSAIENLSLSVLDALRRGIPCVVTAVGGLPELVADGRTGYVVAPGDVHAAADAVSRLLGEPELRARMGFAARVSYEHTFSPEVWERQLLSVHELIGRSPLVLKA